MRGWHAILIALAVTVVLAVFVMVTLPKQYRVERAIEVDATPAEVWEQVGDLRAHAAWAPWLGGAPAPAIAWSEETSGEGAYYEWTDEDGDVARFTITTVDRPRRLGFAVTLDDLGTPAGWIEVAPSGARTAVTWRFEGATEGLLGGVVALAMDRMAGPTFADALAQLGRLAEEAHAAPPPSIDPGTPQADGCDPGGALPPLP